MNTILLVLSLLAAVVLTLLGFEWLIKPDGDPHLFGWVGVTLALYIGSHLAGDYWPRRRSE